MAYAVAPSTYESLREAWKGLLPRAATNTLFVTPCWQRLWWKHFDGQRESLYLGIHDDGELVGIAPLMNDGQDLAIIGSTEVCDYRDLVLMEEHCTRALPALFSYMETLTWSTFVLHSLPAASPTLAYLRELSQDPRYQVSIQQEDVCPRVELPADWDTYLGQLSKKDRHELRRKFRRLMNAGDVRMRALPLTEGLGAELDGFFRLMRDSREEKAAFLTPQKEAFFRDAVETLMERGTAKLFTLEVDGARAASVICFDYNNERLLYNSGFDHQYAHLSVGLLLKAWVLRDAIESGLRRFDFLRGDEPYKYDLGGVDYPVYQCAIQRI
ncbi:MAG: GNAT family N-acetyltransferase [Chloroflexi bacterium]|nr:GNAT family N-acetyltransferase [Chloroflexota bacterium]